MRYLLFDTKTNGCTYYIAEKRNTGLIITTDICMATTFKRQNAASNFLLNLPKKIKDSNNFSIGLLSDTNALIKQDMSKNMTDIIDFMSNKPKKIKYTQPKLQIPNPPSLSNGIQNDAKDIKKTIDNTYISSPKILKTYTPKGVEKQMNNIYQVLSKTKNNINTIPEMIISNQTCLNEQLSKLDKIINDITHFIEFNELNASQGYKMYKILHDFLNQRREVKDLLTKIQTINSNFEDNENYDISTEFKSNNNRSYTPRVLDELFKNGKECL